MHESPFESAAPVRRVYPESLPAASSKGSLRRRVTLPSRLCIMRRVGSLNFSAGDPTLDLGVSPHRASDEPLDGRGKVTFRTHYRAAASTPAPSPSASARRPENRKSSVLEARMGGPLVHKMLNLARRVQCDCDVCALASPDFRALALLCHL